MFLLRVHLYADDTVLSSEAASLTNPVSYKITLPYNWTAFSITFQGKRIFSWIIVAALNTWLKSCDCLKPRNSHRGVFSVLLADQTSAQVEARWSCDENVSGHRYSSTNKNDTGGQFVRTTGATKLTEDSGGRQSMSLYTPTQSWEEV